MTQQLERRDPTQEDEDEDEHMEDEASVEEEEPSSGSEDDEDEDEEDEEPDRELRSKIEEALRASGVEPACSSDDSEEEEVMDDDQMMAIDGKLAEIFRSRIDEKKGGKGAEYPTLPPLARVDPRLQMQMLNVRLPTSRTASLTLWISTSRNNHPALTSRSWSHLYFSLSSPPVRKKASCPRRRLASFVRVSESQRSAQTRMKRLISVPFLTIYTQRLVTHHLETPSRRSVNAVVIWLEPSIVPAPIPLYAPYTANPLKTS